MQRINSFREWVQDPQRQRGLKIRGQIESGIRQFFQDRDFLEVQTPLLVRNPGMEIHIRPMRLESGAYLPTSPEFAMKKLLVGGLERIFQISTSFRDEPSSRTHRPEFTLLEWYRAHVDYKAIMDDTELLIETLALAQFGEPKIPYQGKTISVARPWPRWTVAECFSRHGIHLAQADLLQECQRLRLPTEPKDQWDDLFFKIWLNLVEPALPDDQAVIIQEFPGSQAALAETFVGKDGFLWARRFEFFIGRLELGNAFQELTDAQEQRSRFKKDMQTRSEIYGDSFPATELDEDFLSALEEGLPRSAGIALGVDRLVMLFADEIDIEKTQWLPVFWPHAPSPS